MDDQIVQAGEEPQTETVPDLARKLRKREQRLLERLQEAQQKEARALERLRRAGARLERRRARLERINKNLTLVRQQIADLQITDRQPEQLDSVALAVPVTSEPASMNGSEANAAPVQAAPELAPGPETTLVDSSTPEVEAETTSDTSTTAEPEAVSTSDSTSTAPELVSTPGPVSEISTTTGTESASPADSEQEATRELEPGVAATSEIAASPEQEDALPVSPEQVPASIAEPEATTSLVAEQESQVTSEAPVQAMALAKEAWDAAEAEVQNARNTAHAMASSISFLSKSGGLSNESMAELLRKQSEANKAVNRAQMAASLAYERFLQAQAEAERTASQQPAESTGTVESHAQQYQEDGASPVQDNTADATVHIQTVHPD